MRLTSLAAVLAVVAACSSGTTKDNSYLTLTPSNVSAPADGQTAITITLNAVGMDGTTPFNGQAQISCKKNVLFEGQTQPGSVDTVTITDGNGTVTVTCAAGANCVGSDTISGALVGAEGNSTTVVSFTGPGTTSGTNGTTGSAVGTTGAASGTATTGGTGTATATTSGAATGTTSGTSGVDAGPGGIVFSGATNPYIGIDYEIPDLPNNFPVNTFTFEVTDSTGKIAVAGAAVDFTPGASNAPESYLVGGDGGVVTVVSNTQGLAQVQVHSGQKTGPITVIANVEGTSYSSQGTSAVVGTQPSLTNSVISCTPVNLPVYTGAHLPCESSSPVDKTTTCTAKLVDRFNYKVEVPVAVQFFTEAGNFQSPTVSTPAYGQPNPGIASNTLDTTGNLPEDVSPLPAVPGQAAEPSYTDFCSTTAGHVYNPRDGLVTIIAVFQGEEKFNLGATSVYQPGDQFVDMPQPFVDSNDNSLWDPGELCAGQSVGQVCGGPDGLWDANADVFVQTYVIYTGSAVGTTALPPQDSSITFFDPGPGGLIVPHMSTSNGQVTWADINLNISEASATYGVTFLSGPTGIQVTFPVTGTPSGSADNLSMVPTPLTDCDAGTVPSDAGPVACTICYFDTAITDFSGGFTGTYSVGNNAQAPGSFSVLASEHVEADLASNSLAGTAQ